MRKRTIATILALLLVGIVALARCGERFVGRSTFDDDIRGALEALLAFLHVVWIWLNAPPLWVTIAFLVAVAASYFAWLFRWSFIRLLFNKDARVAEFRNVVSDEKVLEAREQLRSALEALRARTLAMALERETRAINLLFWERRVDEPTIEEAQLKRSEIMDRLSDLSMFGVNREDEMTRIRSFAHDSLGFVPDSEQRFIQETHIMILEYNSLRNRILQELNARAVAWERVASGEGIVRRIVEELRREHRTHRTDDLPPP